MWGPQPAQDVVFAAVRAGAAGFLDKRISLQGLVRTLRGLLRSEAPLSRELASLLVGALHELEATRHVRERSAVLSSREREVLGYVATGARNKQIASHLAISEFTVKRHLQNILRKLELSTRREAAVFCRASLGSVEEAVCL